MISAPRTVFIGNPFDLTIKHGPNEKSIVDFDTLVFKLLREERKEGETVLRLVPRRSGADWDIRVKFYNGREREIREDVVYVDVVNSG